MAEHRLRQRQLRGHQESRPVNRMESHDILTDQVEIGGPPFCETLGIIGVARASEVVGQRIDPHIHDMAVAAGHLDPPVEAGARDGKIHQSAFDEFQNLVTATFRANELGISGDMVKQRLLVFREAEEPAFLGGPVDRRALGRKFHAPFPLDQLLFLVERLVPHRIPALVAAEIEIIIGGHRLPDRLTGAVMIGLRGSDKTIVTDVQGIIHRTEMRGHFRRQISHFDTAIARGLNHLQTVFVGACLEHNITPGLAMEARDGIGGDRFVGVADMRASIGVADRSGDVIGFGHAAALARFSGGWNHPRLRPRSGRENQACGASVATRPAISNTVACASSDNPRALAASERAAS